MTATELPWSIRVALRFLPRIYREHRTAELHATLGDVADSRGLSVGAEALSLVALSIRVRGRSLLAPPSAARSRAAAIGAVVLPVLLIVPAARAIDLGLPVDPLPSGLFWIWSALVPAWIAAAVAGPLTLVGAVRWAHRFSILAVALFIAGLLAQVASTNASTAGFESGWLPLIATSAALNRNPQRVRDGRRALGTLGMAAIGAVGIGGAGVYVAAGPSWWSLLPSALQPVFEQGRLVVGGVLLAVCLVGLASRTMRAAVPLTAALGAAYVSVHLYWILWSGPVGPTSEAQWRYTQVMHWVVELVVIPLTVFLVARLLTALVDRVGRSTTPHHLPV